MGSNLVTQFSQTLQAGRALVASNRELARKMAIQAEQGQHNMENLSDSLDRLERFKGDLNARAQSAIKEKVPVQSTVPAHHPGEMANHMLLHDIRSPLSTVSLLIQLLGQKEQLSEEGKRLLHLAKAQTQRMQDQMQNQLIYQQLEQGIYQPQYTSFNLLQLVKQTQVGLRAQRYPNPVEVRIDGEPVSPDQKWIMNFDKRLLGMMLQNLLQNALEASPANAPVKIDITQKFQAAGNSSALESIYPMTFISLHNQGVIPAVIQPRFFEKFATHGKRRGTGLGTYIAKLAAEACRGVITFTTSERGGTTLRVHLPHNAMASSFCQKYAVGRSAGSQSISSAN